MHRSSSSGLLGPLQELQTFVFCTFKDLLLSMVSSCQILQWTVHCFCPSLAAMSLLQTLIANLCPCLPVERAGQKELPLFIGNRCIAARLGFYFTALLPGSSLLPIHADPSPSHLRLPCGPTHQLSWASWKADSTCSFQSQLCMGSLSCALR